MPLRTPNLQLLTRLLAVIAVAAMGWPARADESRYLYVDSGDPAANYAEHGVSTDMIVIPGEFLLAPVDLPWEKLRNAGVLETELVLRFYITDRLGWTIDQAASYTGVVVIDIRGESEPMRWRSIAVEARQPNGNRPEFNHFILAWKRRVNTVNMLFPNCDIGVRGIATPRLDGEDMDEWRAECFVIKFAARYLKVFDKVTYACPVITPRFGPDDTAGDTAALAGLYRVAASRACKFSRKIRRTDMVRLEAFPLIELTVDNDCSSPIPGIDCSTYHGQHLLEFDPGLTNTVAEMIGTFRQPRFLITIDGVRRFAPPIEQYGFWVDADTPSGSDPTATTDAVLDAIYCRGDYNADGELDSADEQIFLGLFSGGDDRADVDDSGVLDADDLIAFQTLLLDGCD